MRMSERRYRGVAVLAGLATVAASCAVATPANAASPVTPRVAIHAEQPQLANSVVHRLGALGATSRIPLAITLRSPDQAGLDAFVASVSDPHSANYRHFLTPAQFDSRFAPSEASVRTLETYLHAAGLSVTAVSGNRQVVDATGTPSQIQAGFGTTLGQYHNDHTGRSYYANDNPVTVPAALAAVVGSVSGMTSLPIVAPTAAVGTSLGKASGSGPAGGHSPSDYHSIYGMNTLTGSYDGTGQTVGLFEFDGFQQADITKYTQQFSLPTLTPTVVPVDGGVSSLGSGQLEVTLDIDAVDAMAPKATQLVYEAPNTDSAWVDEINKIASDHKITVFSSSWLAGESCESAPISASHNAIAQMVAQGVSAFSASGDWGGHGCDYNGDNSTITVDYLASDPNVTGVGGTTLSNTTANPEAYTSETCWNSASTGNTRSGGGYSSIYATPSYQSSVNSTTHRSVPDVSMDADYNAGALSVYIGSSGGWERVGGTSLASPLWAGYASLLDQKKGALLGALNPTIYSVAGSSQYASTFHDVTSGNNDTYSAKTGYDLCTGWGSMRGDALATALLAGGTQPSNDFSIAVSPTSGSVVQGSSVSATVGTTVTSGSAESVALTASGLPSGAGATFAPTSVTAGNSSTLTIATAASTPAGSYPVTVTGTSTDATHTATYTLTVTGSGSGTVTVANPGNQTGVVGTAVTLNNSASGGTGSYTWSATGLPAGLSISSSSGQITGTPSTAGSYHVTVTATDGNGASGSAQFSWTISAKSGPGTVTVTNPGTQSNYQRTTLSPPLQIQATDSAGNPLRFSATGLPAGLSISASGLISGTFTNWGNYSVTVTATDSSGGRGSASFYWFVFMNYNYNGADKAAA